MVQEDLNDALEGEEGGILLLSQLVFFVLLLDPRFLTPFFQRKDVTRSSADCPTDCLSVCLSNCPTWLGWLNKKLRLKQQ